MKRLAMAATKFLAEFLLDMPEQRGAVRALSFMKIPSGTGSRPVGGFGTTAEDEIDGQ